MDLSGMANISGAIDELFDRTRKPKPRASKTREYATGVVAAGLESCEAFANFSLAIDNDDDETRERYFQLNNAAMNAVNAVQAFFSAIRECSDLQITGIVKAMRLAPPNEQEVWLSRLHTIQAGGVELKAIQDTTGAKRKDIGETLRTQGKGRSLILVELAFVWADLTGALPGTSNNGGSPFETFVQQLLPRAIDDETGESHAIKQAVSLIRLHDKARLKKTIESGYEPLFSSEF
jgi:hypothetical protein